MKVEVQSPSEYKSGVLGSINRRRGIINTSDEFGGMSILYCEVPLADMFGYMTELRSLTQGKGEFSMEYKEHLPVSPDIQAQLCAKYQKEYRENKDS
jgi:elongation factor G